MENAYENIKNKENRGVVGLTGAGVIMRIMHEREHNDYHLIKHAEMWNVYIKRKGGSYNDNEQHWSLRQKSESPFLTDP